MTADHPTRSPDSPTLGQLIRRLWNEHGPEPSLAEYLADPDAAMAWFDSTPHPTRSPDSPDPGHGLLHCHRCGKCICPLHEAIADDTWTEARRLCASCFSGPPRSPDSVRTPDLDVERLGLAIAKHWHDHPSSGYSYGHCASEVAAEYARLAALHPASPPQPDIITDEQAEAWLQANDLTAVTHQHPAGDCDECAAASPPTTVRLHGRAHWHTGEGIKPCCVDV
jgi:hypothetical protein